MDAPPVRRSSFGNLLRRTKSGDLGKNGRRALSQRDAELDRLRQAATFQGVPKLPEFSSNTEQLSKTLGPELQPEPNYSYSSAGRSSVDPGRGMHSAAPPVPPIPNMSFDPYARTESMTHRGRYSYASSAVSTLNSPRRVRRRKDPTPFNILVVGSSSSGKTSFLEFLKGALALPPRKRTKKGDEDEYQAPTPASGNFTPHYLETEIDGERIGLTIWDSEGLEKNLVDLQLREMTAFVESKFEETFNEEMKVVRSPGAQDTHIHATFLVLDPARLDRNLAASKKAASYTYHHNGSRTAPHRVLGALDEDVDLQVMRLLHSKTTVIPIISKADTVTKKHMEVLKKAVWDSVKKSNLDPLEALGVDDDDASDDSGRIDEEDEEEEDEEDNGNEQEERSDNEAADKVAGDLPSQLSPPTSPSARRLSSQSIRRHKAQEQAKADETPFLPLSTISPDLYEPSVIGRQFAWGFADPYDSQHCDFQKLKEAVFSEWRAELRETSKEKWYEQWRTNRLKQRDLPYHRR